ncbi:MAG: isoleucine--tRNA ligase [Candidatus Omnitrophica bacterium CG11_big_fil_rev_8_21_14_0_20_42_13]|uniref:Isoleucine--tRNA ligase n=1 Tax=Candidatus Ghiorseimicrobium undicola TaxID=1974746 RepID=A0A2H0LV80_9BACT|nr:MAG: isoleucine--tRNA ligase [Candidatus Omnitrophica bacterium CG11_big_fil_rev_8_21_14_0_20_42_13]
MDYKATLNLPKTSFPMKANLAQREPEILSFWQKEDLYSLIRKERRGKPKYILHDGPPYANGNIHIGHALNKTLKDIIIKFKTMQGYDAPYVPGWDCHGLPVEYSLFKELGKTKHEVDQVEFRKKAKDYALKFVKIQKDEFIRLGVLGDWPNPYLTLKKEYERDILRSLSGLVRKGYIYRGFKPVNWCYQCETALAEAEVEYDQHTSNSVYVKFKIKGPNFSDGKHYLLIWTTTPWTLPANVAIAVHPDLYYVPVKIADEIIFLAEERLNALKEAGILGDCQILKDKIKGKDLDGLKYEHPFIDREGVIVLADYVSHEEGTGCVHTAPGHGQEDYQTGLKYNLPVIMPVNHKGEFKDSLDFINGVNVHKSDEIIINKLIEKSALLAQAKISHSYPHCWRCKNPVIFRATEQYFLKIDSNNLRSRVLSLIKDIKWVPASGEKRISAMVENRPDWCLSRQRLWGVPIPSLCCLGCRKEGLYPEVIDNFSQIVAREGSDAWFIWKTEDLIPADYACPFCGGRDFKKGNDIIDVWFDSGVSHQAVLKASSELGFPADLYLEGSDQHRGWFQSSLIPAVALEEKTAFKAVLTHGFVVDGEGRKMSKSEGNVIAPQNIIRKYGADILRLWVASSDYKEDIRISDEIIARLSEAYRKIRNTLRFILGNLYDFDINKDPIAYEKLMLLDKWALHRLYSLLNDISLYYENYNFYSVYHSIYNFCIVDLSSFYLDILKDRLYTFRHDSLERRSAQTVLSQALVVLTKIIAPIFSFTSEELWQNFKEKIPDESGSVHLSCWPKAKEEYINNALEDEFARILNLRNMVLKILEEKRINGTIKSSLEAKVTIGFDSQEEYDFFRKYSGDLAAIFITSQVYIEKSAKFYISADRAQGDKCSRCWTFREDIKRDSEGNLICGRCIEAINGGFK